MFKTDVEWYSNYMCFEKKIYWPCNQACRQLTLIVISLKIEKWRPPTLCRKVNYMWNHSETGQNSSNYIDVIIRKVIFMYISHGILYRVNHNLIRFYKFATNRNPTCAELMRKRSSSGVLNKSQTVPTNT